MKKVLLFITTCLVLVSSIVFCGCKDKYEDLEITCSIGEINLVLDDSELKYEDVIFKLSGAKSWGEISIVSKPDGMVNVEYEIIDNQCGVRVQALQPTGVGASLVLTHLGSGVSCSVPLNVGRRLQSVASAEKDFVVQTPTFKEGETVKEIEILNRQLLSCTPSVFTDDIVWQVVSKDSIHVDLKSYDKNGNRVAPFAMNAGATGARVEGTSKAKKTVIVVDEAVEDWATMEISPVSVLKNGKAVFYSDVKVAVKIGDLLNSDNVVATSPTHYERVDKDDDESAKLLKDLVLISNPDPKKQREGSDIALSGYNNYSTALIQLKKFEGVVSAFAEKYSDLYTIQASTNIDNLLLEVVEFGTVRAIASSSCYGSGYINVKFVPKDCVGDVKEFEVTIPCVVGERATSFSVTNNGDSVAINETSPYTFESLNVPLNDSTSYGQSFKFDVLSTNTLSALKKYRIKINQKLIEQKANHTFRQGDDSAAFDISKITPYEYQISILKDGRGITFYDNGDGMFVSEPLTSRNTIYIKWVKTEGDSVEEVDFGIYVSSYYDNDYDLAKDGFNNLSLTYKMTFNRQRTVESVSYFPVSVSYDGDSISPPEDIDSLDDWQLYFTPEMFGGATGYFYGIRIDEVRGLNNSKLANNELENINLNIEISGTTFKNEYVGLALYVRTETDYIYKSSETFNFNVTYWERNIIIIGNIADKEIGYGDYEITISQLNKQIAKQNIKIYKPLSENDITINVPSADYDGKLLKYEKLTEKPADFSTNYSKYYEYIGGEYIQVTSKTWSDKKTYYQKAYAYQRIMAEPDDFTSNYAAYYEYDETNGYVEVASNVWDAAKAYYQKIDAVNALVDIDNTYILASGKQYGVDISIKDDAFVDIQSKSVQAEFVESYKLLTSEPDYFKTSYELYYQYVDGAYQPLTAPVEFETNKYFEKLKTINMDLSNFAKTNSDGGVITTGYRGTYNTETGEKNYIKITYKITPTSYDYYKISTEAGEVKTKSIYVYVYEPLESAAFNKTMLYKYDYNYKDAKKESLLYSLREEFGKETLNIKINGENNSSVLNYVDILWKSSGDNIIGFEQHSNISATYTFGLPIGLNSSTSSVYAVVTQFGVQYAIYCGFNVSKPVLTERLILNTPTQNFKSGGAYINLKVGDSKHIAVEQYSANGKVSMPGLNFATCNMTGYFAEGVISVDNEGNLVAKQAGRAKLVIIANDALKQNLYAGQNYLNTSSYIRAAASNCVLIVDVIVSDGSKENPYLIASAEDFMAIEGDKHYSLVKDIDIKGKSFTIKEFSGSIVSYQETENIDSRFNVYGVMLNNDNSTLFGSLLEEALLQNITFHIDINYKAEEANNKEILIGLIGTNNAKIQNVTAIIDGTIKDAGNANRFVIGSLVAHNMGEVVIDNTRLVGVQGNINVDAGTSRVILGGLIGKNEGTLIGGHVLPTNAVTGEVEYEVYYDNQGATADIYLQVSAENGNANNAIGGVIGHNIGTAKTDAATGKAYKLGTIVNVYATGEIDGENVNNVGGLIGKNNSDIAIKSSLNIMLDVAEALLGSVVYETDYSGFQIYNCYSTAKVHGADNVGGVVGNDARGSYYKVYYEIYSNNETSIIGENNVGGLIGYAENSNLYYCYAQGFAWDYSNTINTGNYDIVAVDRVGGLIGYAKSSAINYEANQDSDMNVISSLAVVNICATGSDVSGLVGKLEGFGAIYTAYYYGVIDASNVNKITAAYKEGETQQNNTNILYNNVYSIINGTEWAYYNGIKTSAEHPNVTLDMLQGGGFNQQEYNNGKPYIEYNGTNLVTIMPSSIEINQAFELHYGYKKDANGNYVLINGEWKPYDEDDEAHKNLKRYAKNSMYKENAYGEYVKDAYGNMIQYEPDKHITDLRYTLSAELIKADNESTNKSNYRKNALLLYYYQFKDMTGEYALEDMNSLNTIDMHDIIADDGIILIPETMKRFTLRSSNNDIVRVIAGGQLLLRKEGQATITIISSLNPTVSASFVVVVRKKVLKFDLYSNANLREEYKITPDTTINVVKGSSKIIEADYSCVARAYSGIDYECTSSTSVEVDLTIQLTQKNGDTETIITDGLDQYIQLNGIYKNNIYTITNNESITISVKEYVEGVFTITAKPYVIATYIDESGNAEDVKNRVPLSDYFTRSFNIVTKKGASAINIDRTQIDMMPADETSNLEVKISTDVQVGELYFEVIDISANSGSQSASAYVEMLDILFNNTAIQLTPSDDKTVARGVKNVSDIQVKDMLQSLSLSLRLNSNAHYVKDSFTLQVRLYVMNATKQIDTILHINVKPQTITSIIPLNYRMNEGANVVSFENAHKSTVIRPGSTNIITIDITPSIAIFEYIEIADITIEDKILFQQVKSDLTSLEHMDTWVDNGIKLKKINATDSKLYILAKLPEKSTQNITHTIQIRVYDVYGNLLKIEYLNLEAIMYPTVVMTYNDPTGRQIAEADTREGHNQIRIVEADLAVGVEAPISVIAYNIDEGSLQGSVAIRRSDDSEITNNNYVNLDYMYGKYILRFNPSNRLDWNKLIGETVDVKFSASKHLNGVTETCEATIRFKLREFVIHGISMTHSTIYNNEDKLYGDWGEEFKTQFYFDEKDISYYNNGYWNIKYTIENTNVAGNTNLLAINEILTSINNLTGAKLYLDNVEITQSAKNDSGYLGEGFSIKNKDDRLLICASKGSNINNMSLRVEFGLNYLINRPIIDTTTYLYSISKQYGFIITDKTTPFDEYLEVWTATDFINMIEGKYYKLMNDIEFDEYTPLDTAIGGFNGQGKIITIKSFNLGQLIQDYISGGMYIGLFSTLAENSVIQNVQVNYENVGMLTDDSVTINLIDNATIKENYSNEIFFGGVAAVNLGVITNTKVLGSFKLLNYIIPSGQIDLGGIAANNGVSGTAKKATITNSTSAINMHAVALIGGVAGTNNGKIVNTKFEGIISNADASLDSNNTFASTIFTSGFVVENQTSGYISLSMVDCQVYDTETNVYSIYSVGNASGFVYNNTGTINNCYIINTNIRSQGNIAGFVYQNGGTLNNCYAYATIPSSLFYQEFIYVTTDSGNINNCYVITDSNRAIVISGLSAIKLAERENADKYVGFVISNTQYGIWLMDRGMPQIASAGFDSESTDYDNIYNIYDVETYQGYFDQENLAGKTFRIVRDIDFASDEVINPITYNKILNGNLEGNDMIISNYNIFKDDEVDRIGLFAEISKVYVRNLTLQPESIKASGSHAVGALAGQIKGAYVYNITIDNDTLLILGKNVVGGLAGIIEGAFDIAGITSNVSVFATYKNTTANQYNLYAGYNVTNNLIDSSINEVSYAGSVAGVINGYNNQTFNAESRYNNVYSHIYDIQVSGSLVLIGETVGAIFGLVGERTLVDNANYSLISETVYRAEYVAGGLVGENRGIIQNSSINISQNNEGEQSDTFACFNNGSSVNGGIVGLNIGGFVSNCSSNITIYTQEVTATVGGIVGRNVEGSVHNCTIYGSLTGFYVGGIVGTDYSYQTVNNVHSGHGIITELSKIVYNNIRTQVKYDINLGMFVNNKISKQFIQNFLNVKNSYYSFNIGYDKSDINTLVVAEKAYGLVIGLTDKNYVASWEYNSELSVDLSVGTANYTGQIKFNYLSTDYTVNIITCTDDEGNIITSIGDKDFNVNKLYPEFAYIIANEGIGYENWSSTTGYGCQVIVLSDGTSSGDDTE